MTDFAAVFRDICVTLFASWLFARYYNSLSDYWAQRSIARTKNRADNLKERLKEYESDCAHIELFIARILRRAMSAMLWMGMAIFFTVAVVTLFLTTGIECLSKNTCSQTQNMAKWNRSINTLPIMLP